MSSLFGGRRRLSLEDANIDLTPVMSLFVCLIPLLVLEAVFYRVATIDVHLPPASAVAMSDVEDTEETGVQEILIDMSTEKLVLHATITHSPEGIAYDPYRDEATVIPFEDGTYDLDLLSRTLRDLKSRYPKQARVILMIADSILFDNIIQVMDTCRERVYEEDGVKLTESIFPNVALSETFDDTDTRLQGLRMGTKGLK